MSNRAKNWGSRQVAMSGAYVNALAGLENIDRRGFMIINTSGVDVLLNPNPTAADATSYTLINGQVFDFYDQPPISTLWLKGASGNVLIFEA
jgi:hypothetical protein